MGSCMGSSRRMGSGWCSGRAMSSSSTFCWGMCRGYRLSRRG
jgi:hypothetical protein